MERASKTHISYLFSRTNYQKYLESKCLWKKLINRFEDSSEQDKMELPYLKYNYAYGVVLLYCRKKKSIANERLFCGVQKGGPNTGIFKKSINR